MKIALGFARWLLCSSLVATSLFGCSANQAPILPASIQESASANAFVQPLLPLLLRHNTAESRATHRDERSWMAPNAEKSDLLYVSGLEGDVYVYSWREGRQIGTLAGFNHAQGLCVDSSANLFVTNYLASNIVEFAHGKKKME